MDNRIAIIDLGTNTFHLLLAERQAGRYHIVYRERNAVKLGMGGINKNQITTEALYRALITLKHYRSKMDEQGITTVHAYGTSALRNASNQDEVLKKIKDETSFDVTVISGDQEAEYIYYGIREAIPLGYDQALIVDIGGGSVEFIIGNRENYCWKQSVETGGQRLMEKFQNHDPITGDEIQQLDKHFTNKLSDLLVALEKFKPSSFVGSSGTFDTLSDIYCLKHRLEQREEDPETPLSIAGFFEIYEELISKNREQRMAIPGMIEMRVDMIVVACCLIRFILDAYPFTELRVSRFSLKEGALAFMSATG